MTSIPTRLRSTDGRTALVEFDHYGLTPRQARDFAADLLSSAQYAERLPDIHERHVNLLASCPLCVAEAGWQTDRLTEAGWQTDRLTYDLEDMDT